MSRYTTGEMAKLCGVSVRTVQYYDQRGLLIPSELSDGGRRLYTDTDVQKLKVICCLKQIGLSLGSIGEILREENCASVVELLLDEQEKLLRQEIAEREKQLSDMRSLRREIRNRDGVSIEELGDIARIMENRRKLRRIYAVLISVGLAMDAVEIITLIYWIRTGVWQPFALGMMVVIALTVCLVRYMHRHTAYICPECHGIFKPTMRAMFFAQHTPRTRKLTCSHCGHKGYCVETHADALKEA